MDMNKAFLRMMAEQREIALATAVDDIPHVRIVNFCYTPEEHRLYFATFYDNDKVRELALNDRVSFTTIPHNGTNEHIRASGIAARSTRTISALADAFTAKIPAYRETIDSAGDALILYEITFDTAVVTVDMEHIETIPI